MRHYSCLSPVSRLVGLFKITPNEAVVLQLFGAYKCTVYDSDLRLANPFYSKRKVSVGVRNFESEKLKVNDLYGGVGLSPRQLRGFCACAKQGGAEHGADGVGQAGGGKGSSSWTRSTRPVR